MKTENKLIMNYVVEHVEAINGNIKEFQKINKEKKHKRSMTPCELFGSKGATITSFDRDMNEVSSVRHSPSRGAEARRDIKYKND